MNEQKRVPTYGNEVSSRSYEDMLKRRDWLKENKNKLILGITTLLVMAGAAITVLVMM